MLQTLKEEGVSLQTSMDKTKLKFDELARGFDEIHEMAAVPQFQGPDVAPKVQEDPAPGSAAGNYWRHLPNLEAQLHQTSSRADQLEAELGQDRQELLELKTHLSQMKAEFAKESDHMSRLEDFVRSIAEGPCASVRTGGGFVLDSTAKREAMGLLAGLGRVQMSF